MDKRVLENLRVKKQIVNAYLTILKETKNSNASITDICKKAHVSRMAYYRNFIQPIEIIQFFFEEILNEIKEKSGDNLIFWSIEYGRLFLDCLLNYKDEILLLDECGYIGLMLTMFNEANLELAGDMPYNSIERYDLYFASGASLNGILEWFRSGCKENKEDFLAELVEFLGSKIKI